VTGPVEKALKDASALRANADNNEMGSGMNSDMGDMGGMSDTSGMNDNSMETQDNTVNDAEFNADNSSSEPPIDNSNGEQESNEFEF
jgi:cobalamin biosynthesis protein CobT